MFRLLALLPLALIPAAVAAPVPPGGRAEFGTNGLLSRADLEKVVFDSQPFKREDGREWSDEAEPEDKQEVRRKREQPDAPQRANRYDVAVHMPWTRFRAGEQMPVYFVLRNNRGSTLGLRSRIDLSGDHPELQGGAVSFDVRDRATGKSVLARLCASTNCGGGSLVDVPGFGYYCVKGDLNRMTGAPLPPGEYEVDWHYGQFQSARVRFTVAPSDAKPVPVARRPRLHFFHLTHGSEDEYPERAGEPFHWNNSQLSTVRTQAMTAVLAVGPGGAFVPDVRAIPAADKFVEAWAVWKPYRDGDRVSVTLRAVPPYEKVCFEELPELFLQIETPADGGERWTESLAERKQQLERARQSLVTPLTIEARLPEGWREWIDASETARVAVLVASKRIEFPRGAGQVLEQVKKEMRVERAFRDRPPVWSGVVRSDFTELRLPPRVPLTPQP